MNHDGIERSSTSVTKIASKFYRRVRHLKFEIQPVMKHAVARKNLTVELHNGASATVNCHPSTVNIVAYELLICKLKECNSIA